MPTVNIETNMLVTINRSFIFDMIAMYKTFCKKQRTKVKRVKNKTFRMCYHNTRKISAYNDKHFGKFWVFEEFCNIYLFHSVLFLDLILPQDKTITSSKMYCTCIPVLCIIIDTLSQH